MTPPRVEVIVPFYGTCAHRRKALDWVLEKHEHPVTVAYGDEPWVKADAIRPAVEASSAEILVMADADCWTDGLPAAIRAVELGAPWAKPHDLVHRLTKESTAALYGGRPWHELDERPYQGVAGGGFVVARRETFLAVPMDPRFVGWGQEDLAFAMALHTLAGPAWLGGADLTHLWHPPEPRLSRAWGSVEGKQLLKRYGGAKGNPELIGQLVKEIHAHQSAQPALHPDPAH